MDPNPQTDDYTHIIPDDVDPALLKDDVEGNLKEMAEHMRKRRRRSALWGLIGTILGTILGKFLKMGKWLLVLFIILTIVCISIAAYLCVREGYKSFHPQSPNQTVSSVIDDADYYTDNTKTDFTYPTKKHDEDNDKPYYCNLDELGRPACAYAYLTKETFERESAEDRQDISVDPIGWPASNPQVDIPQKDNVAGSMPYHGYLFNRSHLLADSLGGDAIKENLITGTRTQNVGSTSKNGMYGGGMAYAENIARSYIKSDASVACPLFYQATPLYEGDELIPRQVRITMSDCGNANRHEITVFNQAQGFDINYVDGTFQRVG